MEHTRVLNTADTKRRRKLRFTGFLSIFVAENIYNELRSDIVVTRSDGISQLSVIVCY